MYLSNKKCFPRQKSRVFMNVESSPNPSSVYNRLCKYRKKVFYCFYLKINYSQIHCIALRVCKLWTGFSVPSVIWVGGGVNANHSATHSPSLAGKNEIDNDPKLLKNSDRNRDDEWNFCWGQEADIALFLQEIKIRNIIKSFEEN